MVPRNGGFLDHTTDPATLPSWLDEADIDFYTGEFERTGFRGGLNWYRNIDASWELLAPYAGAKVVVPALYVAGDRDLVVTFRGMDQLIPALAQHVPNLRRTIMLPGCVSRAPCQPGPGTRAPADVESWPCSASASLQLMGRARGPVDVGGGLWEDERASRAVEPKRGAAREARRRPAWR